jgi:hypothetical protein
MKNANVATIQINWPDDKWDTPVEQEYLLNCLRGVIEHLEQHPLTGPDTNRTITNKFGRVYAEIEMVSCKQPVDWWTP